jgi:hypothetical protein
LAVVKRAMIYQKNLPVWERAIRVMMGLGLIAGGLLGLHGGAAGYSLVAMGGMVMVTGFIGFCPACAMVGRKMR